MMQTAGHAAHAPQCTFSEYRLYIERFAKGMAYGYCRVCVMSLGIESLQQVTAAPVTTPSQ